jgi:DNA polymerase-3 subunit alpha
VQAIEAILAARSGQGGGPRAALTGPFTSLFDFCARVDRGRVNKRTVEALIRAGAFDSLERHRASLLASVEAAFDYASHLAEHANQGGLFDSGDEPLHGSAEQEPALVSATPWSVREQLTEEKAALGLYLSGHLFDAAATEVRRFVKRRIDELIDSREPQLLAGIVSDLRLVAVQRGRLALFKLDDGSGVIDARADEALWQNARNWLKDDALIIVSGQLKPDRFSGGMQLFVNQAWNLELARCRHAKHLLLEVDGPRAPRWEGLSELLKQHAPQREFTPAGEVWHGVGVRLRLRAAGAQAAQADLELDERARFFPRDAALGAWDAWARPGSVTLIYE